ncbi:hypothetical protein WJX75_000244 [Coccomyxa subellipsoidea]|uniref:Uncharacterized protein n=1 Tax=Coccomyxa subellipsoidea TaxID=248742 RepID=A0ABR2YAE3_9CHLO
MLETAASPPQMPQRVRGSVVHSGVPREAGPALVGTLTQRRAQWMSAIPSGSSDGGLLDLRALPMTALQWEACLPPPAQLLMAAPLGKEHGRQAARGVARTKQHPRVDVLGLPPCLSSACIGLLRRMTQPQVMRLGRATCLEGP